MASDSPLVSPEDVREQVGGLERAGDVLGSSDELLAAMLENQQHFYTLWQAILDEQRGTPADALSDDLDAIQAELRRVNDGIAGLGEALGSGAPARDERNFRINRFDLNKRDWVLSNEGEGFAGAVPDVQGADEVAIFVESLDDAGFDLLIRFVDEEGNTRTEVDSNIDSELSSTSPAGANHHTFVTVAIADRLTDIVVTDTSGGQNRVSGNMNFH